MGRRSTTFEDPVVLKAALEGLELQKKRIELQMAEIRAHLGKRPRTTQASDVSTVSKRNLSAEARKRIASAQKKRWAEYRKSNAGPK
jgi:hypothetical protein